MTYSHVDRARMRSAISRTEGLGFVSRIVSERGATIEAACEIARVENPKLLLDPAEVAIALDRITGTSDASQRVIALDHMADQFKQQHIGRLTPLAKDDFNAFCEVMNPEEPPSSAWHIFLTDQLQQIEVDPSKNRFILNCPPGHAKPLHVNTPVTMADGTLKPLGKVQVGDRVISGRGASRKVTAVHEQGTLPILRVETAQGRVVLAAPDHPFEIAGADFRNQPVFVEARHLVMGDPLVVTPTKPGRLTLDPDMVDLMALWVAHGATALVQGAKISYPSPQVWIKKTHPERYQRLIELLERLEVHHTHHQTRAGWTIRIPYTRNADLSQRLRLWEQAGSRRLPDELWQADRTSLVRFLGTYLSARGVIKTTCPRHALTLRVALSSEVLAEELQHLLARLAVNARIERVITSRGNRTFTVILDHATLQALRKAGISYTGSRAADVAALKPAAQALTDHVEITLPVAPAACRCLTVETDHTFLAQGLSVHNSTYASRLYVVWRMGRNPNLQVIGGGHSQKFVENQFSAKNRNMIATPAYQGIFPGVAVNYSQKAKGEWAIAGTKGQYIAKGVGQGVHGFRANFVVVDDPYAKVEDAESPAVREGVKTWFLTDIGTRMLPGGKIFVIMTRFHEDDLTGTLLELNKEYAPEHRYAVVEAPAICYDPENDCMGRQVGEVLWDYYDINYFQGLRAGQTFQRFALIYQQLADAASDDSIASHFQYYQYLPHKSQEAFDDARKNNLFDDAGRPKPNRASYFRRVILSVDTASKDTERADYSVMQVWGQTHKGDSYLFDQVRIKAELPKLIVEIEKLAKQHDVDQILVEDKGNGTAYIQARGATATQKRLAPAPIVAIKTPPNQGKTFRWDEVTPIIEEGKVYLPKNAPWVDLYIREVGQFPEGAHDDQVDATSQALRYFKSTRNRYGSKKAASMG